MENNNQIRIQRNALQMLSLEQLNSNIPFQQSIPLSSSLEKILLNHPPPIIKTQRHKIPSINSNLKQILSRSLFLQNLPKSVPTKQKPKVDLRLVISDSKPYSPQSQQKVLLKQISKQQNEIFDEYENLSHFSSREQILDNKFNKILDHNFHQQVDFNLQLQSMFTSKIQQKSYRTKRSSISDKSNKDLEYEEVELLSPSNQCVTLQSILQHQRLLQEQNGFIRQQLQIFTNIIEEQRSKGNDLKHKWKKIKQQNNDLKQKNRVVQQYFLQIQQKFNTISTQNQEYRINLNNLTKENQQLIQKFYLINKQFQEVCNRLYNYEFIKDKQISNILEQKNKEIQQYCEEIIQKDKSIEELNQTIELLQNKINQLEQIKKQHQQNSRIDVNNSIYQQNQEEKEEEEIQSVFSENKMRNSSICLSLAQAESLKNIIEAKEVMFQKELENIKTKSIHSQQSYAKTIKQLNEKIKKYQENEKNSQTSRKDQDVEKLENTYKERISTLQSYLHEEREYNSRLLKQIGHLKEKYEILEKEQDEDLQDLLENCVNELEKERTSNYLLKQEITSLKRNFANKEIY